MRFVVMGAGAVGSVLGGLLSVSKHDVLMVGRDDHMRSISADGLRLKSSTAEYLAHPRTINRLSEKDIDADTVVMITAKSHDTSACLDEIARVAPPETTILTMQNGIRNEELAAVRFRDVYGGVCRMTCSMLQPGQASFRHIGRVVVGLYPKGTSPRARAIGKAFAAAGLEVCVSRSIMGDKWLKMAVNVTSAVNAVVDARDHDTPAFFELKARLLEETAAVLAAEKIKPKSFDGKDLSIAEMIAELRRPRARRTRGGVNIHNSTWQDLYLKRDRIESSEFHGPIIAMAKKHSIGVPSHEALLEMVSGCHGRGAAPQSIRLDEILNAIKERIAPN